MQTLSIARSRLTSRLGWTRHSYYLLSAFVATLFVIGVVWWPLVEEQLAWIDWSRPLWLQMDWLLLGVFMVMSLLIMAGANLKADVQLVFVGFFGGLVIESWGTQTVLWTYYTLERPPLWILPAWPIATLSIDRLYRMLNQATPDLKATYFRWAYWALLPAFYMLMVLFVWPTMDKSLTMMALGISLLIVLTPTDHRIAVLTFVAGSALGYFLELWGTTRACWTYYTHETPPFFAVLAHGFAAVVFWRVGLLCQMVITYATKLSPGLQTRRNRLH